MTHYYTSTLKWNGHCSPMAWWPSSNGLFLILLLMNEWSISKGHKQPLFNPAQHRCVHRHIYKKTKVMLYTMKSMRVPYNQSRSSSWNRLFIALLRCAAVTSHVRSDAVCLADLMSVREQWPLSYRSHRQTNARLSLFCATRPTDSFLFYCIYSFKFKIQLF